MEDEDGIQLWADKEYDAGRKTYFENNKKQIACLWVILSALAIWCSDSWPQVLREHLLWACTIGIFLGWTFTEYVLHRFLLHEEVTLDLDAPYSREQGVKNAENFSKHIHHHVFMNQRNRIVANLPGHWQLIAAVFVVFSLVLPAS